MKLLVTLKGEGGIFRQVALDEAGGRVAAVTTDAICNPNMNIRGQIAAEMKAGPSRQVYVWELPTEKPRPPMQKNDH
jgi:hypothetical protein